MIPEKWVVKVTEKNTDIINAWKQKSNYKDEAKKYEYVSYDGCGCSSLALKWHIEISFDQFQQHILNKNNMQKEIIGYLCPQDLFNGCIKAGSLYVKAKGNAANGAYIYNNDSTSSIPKEIVEQWKPVYTQDELKVGDWVITTQEDFNMYNKYSKGELFKVTKVSNEYVYYEENSSVLKHRIRKATKEEVKNYLLNEAGKLGFIHGVKCLDSFIGLPTTIYEDKWATIVPQKEVVKITCSNNRDIEVEVTTDGIKYDGTTLSIKVIQEILNFTTTVNGWAVVPEMFSIGCREGIDRDDLQKVLDVYNKLNK